MTTRYRRKIATLAIMFCLFFLLIAPFRKIPAHADNPLGLPDKPVAATIYDAILMALENNQSLAIERLNPLIQKTLEQQEQAVFDPLLNAQLLGETERAKRIRSGGGIEGFSSAALAGNIEVEKFFPTGTRVAAGTDIDRLDSSLNDDYFATSRLGLTVTQALLKNYGIGPNLANLKQARLDTFASQYELRGFSESLVSQVESSYWDYVLAGRQVDIVQESLQLSRQHEQETEEMIKVGTLPESELVAANAETALRRQDLIDAQSTREVSRLRLLRLINPRGANVFNRVLMPLSKPDLQEVKLDDVDAHVAVAMRLRSDLNQARLQLQRNDLELVKTKNGLLPRLDLFITLGKTGYANSFGSSIRDIARDGYDFLMGVNFEFPLKNRDASARHDRARLNREQTEKALSNLSQLIELDVRSAYVEVDRAHKQIAASSVTRKLEEQKLHIETEKFRVGRSTNFLVAQAQRDLLLSQTTEIRAVISYLKALAELFRLEGSLLNRRGISAPGQQPPEGFPMGN